RDWAHADVYGIESLLTNLNRLRSRHPAVRRLRGLTIHPSSNPNVLCFSRHLSAAESPSGKADTVITVVCFDAHNIQEGVVWLDLGAMGYTDDAVLTVD